jgi:two-component system chemotaxis response regulator CheY
MKVLVVEDSHQMRVVVRTMLKRMGYGDVLEAANGAEAWEKMQFEPVDLLLTDWNMPTMGGLELLTKVRTHADYADLPIVLFTARTEKEDVVNALKAGTDTYLAKPFDQPQLKTKIDSVMRGSGDRLIQRIVGNADAIAAKAMHPLIIIGESACTQGSLKKPDNRAVVDYLRKVTSGLALMAEKGGSIGYVLEDNTSNITRQIKQLGTRLRMLLLSIDVPGGGVTLARLASINKPDHLAVCLSCQPSALPAEARSALEGMGVILVSRDQIDAQTIHQLLEDNVVGKLKDEAVEKLPSPEQIRARIERDIQNLGSLPVLPQVYHQITALDKDPDSDIQDWARVIDMDPLSKAQVIRRARSPAYGFKGEITEAKQAVILLGKNTVKELVVSAATRKSLDGIGTEELNVDDYWIHSVGVAITARLLSFGLDESQWSAEQRKDFEGFGLGDEALELLRKLNLSEQLTLAEDQDPFVAGMMHDIGKVALICSYPGIFTVITQSMELDSWNTPMLAVENAVAGGGPTTP